MFGNLSTTVWSNIFIFRFRLSLPRYHSGRVVAVINMDCIPPAVANNSVHLAAMNTGFKSDVGLAVMMHPPID